MAKDRVNSSRFDPYKTFKFRVKWDGKYVAGVSKVGGLKRTTDPVTHAEDGEPSAGRRSPGRTEYEAITMEQGVTHDPGFEAWASQVSNYCNARAEADQQAKEVPPSDLRKNLVIDVFDEAGQKVASYEVFRAWVSEFAARADLDANANAILIQLIKIEHEGVGARRHD
jgi:phage tail-like protein